MLEISTHKEQQLKYLNSDTFNFLVQLRIVSLGSYYTLLTLTRTSTKSGKEFIKELQRYWPQWLAEYKPNIFQISHGIRNGYLAK